MESNKPSASSNTQPTRKAARFRAWVDLHRHEVGRQLLYGAASKLGGWGVTIVIAWLIARY